MSTHKSQYEEEDEAETQKEYNYITAFLDGEEDDVPGPGKYTGAAYEALGKQFVSHSATEPTVIFPKTNHCDWMKVLITKNHDTRNERTVCAPGPIYEVKSTLDLSHGVAFTKASTHRDAGEAGADVPTYKRNVPMYDVTGNIEKEAKQHVIFGKDPKFVEKAAKQQAKGLSRAPGPGEYEVRGTVSMTAGRSFGAGRESRYKQHPGHKGGEVLGTYGPGPQNIPKNMDEPRAHAIPRAPRMKGDTKAGLMPGPGAYVIKRGFGVNVYSCDKKQAGVFLGPPARSRVIASSSKNEYFRKKAEERINKRKFKPRFTWAAVDRRGTNIGLQF